MAIIGFGLGLISSPPTATGAPLASAPEGQIETGVPPTTMLGRESLGLDALPTDLHHMPDGRILIVAPRQLVFGDGMRWETINRAADDRTAPLVGVVVNDDGRIYAGMQDGFGEVVFAENGTWSLKRVADFPADLAQNVAVPRYAINLNGRWFWHSESGIIIEWTPGHTPEFFGRASTVESIFEFQSDLYLSDRVIGQLFRTGDGEPVPIFSKEKLTADDAITTAIPFNDEFALVGTYSHGLKLFDGQSLRDFTTTGMLAGDLRFLSILPAPRNRFVAAIDGHGLVYFDREGRVLDVLDRSRDTRLTRIRRIITTGNDVYWALLTDGVVRVEFPNSLTTFESLLTAGIDSIAIHRFEGKLWLLADGKVLRAHHNHENRLIGFYDESPPEGFGYSLSTATGHVLAGTDRGLYQHNGTGWVLLDADSKNFRLLSAATQTDRWVYSAAGEVGWFSLANGLPVYERHPIDASLSVFDYQVDGDGIFWLEMGSGRLGRLSVVGNELNLRVLNQDDGVPEGWVQVYIFNGQPHFNIADRLFSYDAATRRLVPDREMRERLSEFRLIVGRPVYDNAGRFWVTGDDRVHLYDTTTEPWTNLGIDLPGGLTPFYMSVQDDDVVWLHGFQRLARYDPALEHVRPPLKAAFISRIVLTESNRTIFNPPAELPDLSHNNSSMVVHFMAPGTDIHAPSAFEMRLNDEAEWTDHGTAGSAVINGLAEGSYELQIRAKSGDTYTTPTSVRFTILAPWFRTNLAYFAYAVGAVGLIGGAIWISTILERRENLRLDSLVRQRTTELKETNDQLEEQVEEIRILSQAINQSPVSILITQSNGTILFANPRACELTGLRESDLIGRKAESIRVIENGSSVFEAIKARLDDGETWSGELTNRHTDGHRVHVRSTISPIKQADGSVRFHLILDEDITQWLAEQETHRRLEDQLFQARKLESIGTLAGGIAHDFNNILTGILGNCEIALMDVEPDSELANDLNDIRKSGLRAKDLVSQILTFSRKADSKLIPVDLEGPVSEALKLVRATTPSFIEIKQNLHSGLVLADATQIHQIVLNLCTNAAHAIDDKSGRIDVELKPFAVDASLAKEVPGLSVGPHLILIVSDNGMGMDAATMERIFDPFFTTKDQGKGTGMGLSIVQGIMASHQGAYRVRSRTGAGTTFELYFPICGQKPAARETPSQAIAPGASREILVVDDEPTVADFVSTRLRQFGYRPCTFGDPREALAAYRAEPNRFSALVSDLTMPHLTGADLIQELRNLGSQIPALIITGYGRENALEKLHTLSNTYVLGKPFSGEELTRLLGRALRGETETSPPGPWV